MAGEVQRQQPHGIPRWQIHEVCRELATGDMTQAAIGRKYGVTRQAINDFARRHARVIDEIRADLDDDFAGLWIADKRNRISALQREYELACEHRNSGHHEWIGKRMAIIRAVAEELGQIPNRSTMAVTGVVTHKIIGVSLDECFPEMPDIPDHVPDDLAAGLD